MTEQTKICNKCGRELPLTEFYRCSRNKDGLQYTCKSCHKQYGTEYRNATPQGGADVPFLTRTLTAKQSATFGALCAVQSYGSTAEAVA